MPRAWKNRPPLFMNHHEIAYDMGVAPGVILRWIDQGKFPLLHSVRGIFRLWIRADYDHYIAHRRWPIHLRAVARRRTARREAKPAE